MRTDASPAAGRGEGGDRLARNAALRRYLAPLANSADCSFTTLSTTSP